MTPNPLDYNIWSMKKSHSELFEISVFKECVELFISYSQLLNTIRNY
jgi:hypothetical protein